MKCENQNGDIRTLLWQVGSMWLEALEKMGFHTNKFISAVPRQDQPVAMVADLGLGFATDLPPRRQMGLLVLYVQ